MKTRRRTKTKPFTVKLTGRPLNARQVAEKYGLSRAEFTGLYSRAVRFAGRDLQKVLKGATSK
ncbi:MAG: hypothetical protein HY047_05565 [Acidobacteria bacterium]|nr:hypothetical protein [Acidobacteriota bacterium]